MKRDVKSECTECGGKMTAGTVVDFRRNEAKAAEWVPGEVAASVWTGGIKNTERFMMTGHRCTDCGFLKIYAREQMTPPGWLG